MTHTPIARRPSNVPNHVLHLSRLLALSCTALIFLLPIAVAGYWALADTGSLAVRAANLVLEAIVAPLAPWQRLAGALLMEGALLPLLIGLRQAQRCFAQFASGQIFTRLAVRCLQRFAGWTLVSVLAGIVTAAAISVLITLHNPPGLRQLAVGVGTDQVFSVFFAGMVWLMAAVIGQGQALADENASFI
jgi:hypothetical protein